MLKDFVGNEKTVQSLRALMEREEMPHAILFTGQSGCGKTTLARIVAARLKVGQFDFVENNAADFRGIDSVRDILRQMNLSPMSGPCRVWLLDECHQLSKDAQHAILKALEEPPKHVYFLLATTDPEKLLPTIKTRCVMFDLASLHDEQVGELVKKIAKAETVEIPTEVVDQIVQDSLGSARMALTILDKIINMDPADMLAAAKQQAADQNETIELCRALMAKRPWRDVARIIKGIDQEPEQVRRAVLGYASAILLSKDNGQAYLLLDAFQKNFFDTGKAGLVMAAYQTING
jgi:DNA polymerase III gamma/tau subunit